jgi:hypothetical protein
MNEDANGKTFVGLTPPAGPVVWYDRTRLGIQGVDRRLTYPILTSNTIVKPEHESVSLAPWLPNTQLYAWIDIATQPCYKVTTLLLLDYSISIVADLSEPLHHILGRWQITPWPIATPLSVMLEVSNYIHTYAQSYAMQVYVSHKELALSPEAALEIRYNDFLKSEAKAYGLDKPKLDPNV